MTFDADLLHEADALDDGDGDAVPEESYGYQPVNWRTMSPTEQRIALDELTEWVHWLWNRYPITRKLIPDCWEEHAWAVEELSALHVGWLVCFDDQDSGLGPLQWHERFHQARERIRRWDGTCGTTGTHRPDATR
jgi:hypothetical protein